MFIHKSALPEMAAEPKRTQKNRAISRGLRKLFTVREPFFEPMVNKFNRRKSVFDGVSCLVFLKSAGKPERTPYASRDADRSRLREAFGVRAACSRFFRVPGPHCWKFITKHLSSVVVCFFRMDVVYCCTARQMAELPARYLRPN